MAINLLMQPQPPRPPKQNMFKRISREIVCLYTLFDSIHMDYSRLTNTHNIKISDEKGTYVFTLNTHYPFHPPNSITVNDIPFEEFCNINAPRFQEYLKIYKNELKDLCKPNGSVSLKRNWGPANTIIEVMLEVKNLQILKKRLIMYALLDTIGLKYGIPQDIRIHHWLVD